MINNLFLSVGAMKAGTTWLYERLKDHPDVFFTPEKEIHYLANKFGIENQLNHRNRLLKLKSIMSKYHNGNAKFILENISEIDWYVKYARASKIDNDWYISLFDELAGQKYCADFSNLYCQMHNEAWANVSNISNNVKVIYTLRDPMKRLWSHYKFHHKWVGKEDSVLDDGFELFKSTLDKSWFYENANYAGNLRKVIAGVGEENVLVLYFEDFRTNPNAEAKKISNFLNISPIVIPEESVQKKSNATKDFSMPNEWQAYAEKFLTGYIQDMQDMGLWHKSWVNI
ncbi:sulfotransferase [Cobetia amphilecti]|nr:sulfotransferase [Cobetia litoralis]